MNNAIKVVLAAGGNPTGIICLDDSSERSSYASVAKKWMAKNPSIEQFGFLEGTAHFEMSGGEFCGNAARSVAMLISEKTGKKEGSFTISGFKGTVSFKVFPDGEVECVFPGFQVKVEEISVLGNPAKLVDMGGIVHVVLSGEIPFTDDQKYYEEVHREVMQKLGLSNRAAVGVIWQEKKGSTDVMIRPVVWVKDINSFFYETSCGSGTLATLIANGLRAQGIYQPTGQSIYAERRDGDTLLLRSVVQHSHSKVETP